LKSLKRRQSYGDFSNFQNGGRRHVGFLKLQFSNSGTHHVCRWRSVQPDAELLQFLDFSRWWLPPSWLLTIKIFNIRNGQEGQKT